ncbi:MAG: beta strand repeat-containing protein [Flavobacteriia bacterium]|jgi:subtilisin-like proprotein convertase family protein
MRSMIYTRTGSDNLGTMEFMKNLILSLIVVVVLPQLIFSQTFSNTSNLCPTDNNTTGTTSVIAVSGTGTSLTSITVNIPNISHTYYDDLDIMLISPTGQRIILMSDCGGDNSNTGNRNYTFVQGGIELKNGSQPTASGNVSPTNFEGDAAWPDGAPDITTMNQFTGNPNGNWILRVRDDASGDTGCLDGGWSITIVATTPTPQWKTTWVSMNTGASTWCPGESRNVTVTVTNAAASTWTNSAPDVNIGVKWNGDADFFVRADANGLVSGATQTYTFTVTAPNAGGTNNLSFDVVNEGNFWFASNSGGAGPNNVVYTSAQITISAPPTVTTDNPPSAVANFTATSGGNVTATGGSSVTARGVLWGISPGLTMPSASSTSDGTGTGSFTSSIAGLSASTIYYYRAYAQNCAGYGYGPEYTFVTTGPSAEGYYISGNVVNNGEIISTYDENYLRLTGTSKTITGSGKFTNSKLFADGTTTFDAGLNAASAFTETFVNAGKSLTIATGRTFKNGTMANYGTLTITGTGIINNTSNWFNGATGTVTFGGAGTIYAGANWTNDGTFTAGTGTVEFNGSTSGNTINGTTAFYNATINKGSSTATILDVNGTVTQTNSAASLTFTNGLLRIPSSGSWTKTGNNTTIGANSGIHINGGTFTLNSASITNNGLFKTTTGTANIGSVSDNSITNGSGSSFIIDGAGTVNLSGRLVATGTGSINQSAGTLNLCTEGNTSSSLGSLDMEATTSFTMSGGALYLVKRSTGGTQIDYKNLAGTVSITGGTLTVGTTNTAASSNFNIQGAMPPLVVDNTTNAKTATINGTSTVYGNVTINPTSSLVLNSGVTATVNGSLSNSGTYNATGTLNLAGNWVNNGTFTSNAGNEVAFNGTSASTIGGSSANNFYKLTMNKGNAAVVTTLASALNTVTNELALTSGILDIAGYDLDLAANTVSGGLTSASYVRTSDAGVFKRTVGSSATLFPIGNSAYNPATLTNSGTSDKYSIRVIDNVTDNGTGVGTQTSKAVVNRTWMIDEALSGGSNVTLRLNWNNDETINNFAPANAFIAHYVSGSSMWDNMGGTVGGGYVSATGLTSFSPYTVSSDGSFAPLPIELISFQANCANNNTVDITWSTASEHNTNYFRVDKSRDGLTWDVLNTIGAAGNSNYVIDYALTDAFPNPGINYYRLTQYDNDGVFETFDAQAAVCKDQQSGTALSSYPNPSSGDFNVDLQTDELEGEATLLITDAKGAVVHSQDIKIIKGNNNFVIQKFNAEPGIYYISVRTATSTVTTKHSMR